MPKHLQFTLKIRINYFICLQFPYFKKNSGEQLAAPSHKLQRIDEEVIFPPNSFNNPEKLVTYYD
jgi:hypothetical protein